MKDMKISTLKAELHGRLAARNREICYRILTGGETLDAVGQEYGVSRERIRQLVLEGTGRTKREINEETKRKKNSILYSKRTSIAMRVALDGNMRCVTCGGHNIRGGWSAYVNDGVSKFQACSNDCAQDYLVLRHRLKRREYEMHQAVSILKHKSKFPKFAVDHARRTREGSAGHHPNRYFVKKGTKSYRSVVRVRKLRKALGTEDMFTDEISTMEIRN